MSELVRDVFSACQQLTNATGRPFSPDGHLVGSMGEVLAAEQLGLNLMTPSNRGYDAVDSQDRKVEIKATTRSAVALSASGTAAERLIVVHFDEFGVGSVVYDGPAAPAWESAGRPQKNGQRRVSLGSLRRIQDRHKPVGRQ